MWLSAHAALSLTNVGLAKEPAALGGGGVGWGVLDLRGSGRARLAHAVGAVHDGGVGVGYEMGIRLLGRQELVRKDRDGYNGGVWGELFGRGRRAKSTLSMSIRSCSVRTCHRAALRRNDVMVAFVAAGEDAKVAISRVNRASARAQMTRCEAGITSRLINPSNSIIPPIVCI